MTRSSERASKAHRSRCPPPPPPGRWFAIQARAYSNHHLITLQGPQDPRDGRCMSLNRAPARDRIPFPVLLAEGEASAWFSRRPALRSIRACSSRRAWQDINVEIWIREVLRLLLHSSAAHARGCRTLAWQGVIYWAARSTACSGMGAARIRSQSLSPW